jgi:amino acid permease
MTTPTTPSNQPKQQLSTFSAIAIIVGIVIGAGIFKTPSMVAGVTGDAGWLIVAWVLGGVISLAGALCYAHTGIRRTRCTPLHAHQRGRTGPDSNIAARLINSIIKLGFSCKL